MAAQAGRRRPAFRPVPGQRRPRRLVPRRLVQRSSFTRPSLSLRPTGFGVLAGSPARPVRARPRAPPRRRSAAVRQLPASSEAPTSRGRRVRRDARAQPAMRVLWGRPSRLPPRRALIDARRQPFWPHGRSCPRRIALAGTRGRRVGKALAASIGAQLSELQAQ